MKLPPPPNGYDASYFRQLNHLVQQLGNRAVTNEGGQTRLDGDIHGDGDATFNIGDGTFLVENDGTTLLEVDGSTGVATFSGTISGSIDGDADTVDGYHGAEFGVLAENETVTGAWTLAPIEVAADADNDVAVRVVRASSSGRAQITLEDENESQLWRFGTTGAGGSDLNFFDGSSNVLALKNGGDVEVSTGDVFIPNHSTTALSASAHLDGGDGGIRRSTSSLRYKDPVADMTARESRRLIRSLRPFWYRSKCDGDDPDMVHPGFGAEEVAELDDRFVQFSGDGDERRPEYVSYDRLTAPLAVVASDHEDRIAELEAQVAELLNV